MGSEGTVEDWVKQAKAGSNEYGKVRSSAAKSLLGLSKAAHAIPGSIQQAGMAGSRMLRREAARGLAGATAGAQAGSGTMASGAANAAASGAAANLGASQANFWADISRQKTEAERDAQAQDVEIAQKQKDMWEYDADELAQNQQLVQKQINSIMNAGYSSGEAVHHLKALHNQWAGKAGYEDENSPIAKMLQWATQQAK